MTRTRLSGAVAVLLAAGLAVQAVDSVDGDRPADGDDRERDRRRITLMITTRPAHPLRVEWSVGSHDGRVPVWDATRWVNTVFDARVGDAVSLKSWRLRYDGPLECVVSENGDVVARDVVRHGERCEVTYTVGGDGEL